MALILYLVFGLFVSILLILLSHSRAVKEKARTFECGFDPSGRARIPFCMKFFLVAVIFLIFDVEICLILPIHIGPLCLSSFLVLLLLGTVYE